jgi:hypothetical protein
MAAALAAALSLHPDNPRYFLFRGKPTILVTSAEHYGAVLNQDFNYHKYLATLHAAGLNYTRIFTGVYREVPGDFRIARNTLAPQPGRGLWPFDDAYEARLRDFVSTAARYGIVVEVTLFCPYYRDTMWQASPLYDPAIPREEALTLKHPRLTRIQEDLTRRVVSSLREFDNVFYEICNEPYERRVAPAWEAHIAQLIHDIDPTHLIAQNIANGSHKITSPNPLVSIFNFHYAHPPDAVAVNWDLRKPIGYDETGFSGAADAPYRLQAWDFLVAGGALFNNLDYSFAVGHEDGTFVPPDTNPGGGSPALRRQLRFLQDFFRRLDFLHMAPDPGVTPAARVFSKPGQEYVLYLHHGRRVRDAKPPYQIDPGPHTARLKLNLPAGRWHASWIDPQTGKVSRRERFRQDQTLVSPAYQEDIVLHVTRP